MPKRRRSLVLAAAAVLLGACTLDAGSKAKTEFEEHFRTAYPQDIAGFDVRYSNDMPTLGTLSGVVLLRPEAAPEVARAVLAEVEAYEPSVRVHYTPLGVEANGLGLCLLDEQLEDKQALRDALHADGVSLAGRWGCRGPRYDAAPRYEADLPTFLADTRLARPHLEAGTDLQLTASITDPPGSVTGPWGQVPTSLGPTLAAIQQTQVVSRFELAGTQLRVAIEPTADLAGTQAAADRAAGDDLTVTVLPGSLDEARATSYARLGGVVDTLRAQPGVTAVTTGPFVEVTVGSSQDAVAVHDLARAMPEFTTDTHLRLIVGGDRLTGSTYEVTAASDGGHVQLFADLVEVEGMAAVVLHEAMPTRAFWLRLKTEAPFEEVLPRVRPLLPGGTPVELYRRQEGIVRFTAQDTLSEADLTASSSAGDRVDLDSLARAWNAAPP